MKGLTDKQKAILSFIAHSKENTGVFPSLSEIAEHFSFSTPAAYYALSALEEKGLYYQYYDESHDNGDYGEKYFDKYLEKQPRSINVICDKALSRFNKNKIDEALEYMDKAEEKYNEKEELFGEDNFREVERAILLQNVDSGWMDHIDAMDDLKGNIGLQAYAHRDPVVEYRMVGADMFDAMVAEIRDKTVRALLTVVPKPQQEVVRVQVAKPLTEGFEGGPKQGAKKVVLTPKRSAKVGRNDPCPCGSGKKYKNCCGANPAAGNGNN